MQAPVLNSVIGKLGGLFIVVFSLLAANPVLAADHPLHINDAVISLPVKSASVVAGYASIMNMSEQEIRIVGVSSEAFASSEIHESTVENDVAKMRKIDELILAAGKTTLLQHGGFHLMLRKPVKPLLDDQKITVLLELSNGHNLPVEFTVMAGVAAMKHGMEADQDSKTKHSH